MDKILIVDDSKDIRELVKATLGEDSYQVFEARSGDEAVTLAKKRQPDVIIMDIIMPGGIDGITAAQTIRNDPRTRACHIVFLSGTRLDAKRLKAVKSADVDYFIKPFSPLGLLEKIESLLKKRTHHHG